MRLSPPESDLLEAVDDFETQKARNGNRPGFGNSL
jgi:hypothetical protein